MVKQRYPRASVFLGLLLMGVFAAAGYAQPAPPPPALQPCTSPQIQCPTPSSTSFWVHINLQPDSGSVCRFDPRTIQDLDIPLGGNVDWTFCNTCQTDMEVELTVPPPNGLFDKFTAFFPIPVSAHQLLVDVPCNDTGSASGFAATSSGEWKYTLRAKAAGTTGGFSDEIDPRLEIDDRPLAPDLPDRNVWLERVLLLLVGLVAGAYIARRMSSRSSPR